MTAILFPFRIDKPSPQATIVKEVGKRINADVYAYAAKDTEFPPGISPIWIPNTKSGKVLRYIRAYLCDIDIIHTGPYTHNIVAPLGRISQSAQIVHTLHAVDGGAERKWLVKNADMTTAVSQFVAQESGYQADAVVPNGVSFDRFTPDVAAQSERFIYVGRLEKQKNASLLPDIARKTDRIIDVYGDGSLKDEIQDTAPDNLNIHGWISRNKLPAKYSSAAAMICPYEREGFGMTVLEGLASGTPVVGLRSGALPELIIDGENGFLVDELDPSRWSQTLEMVSECDMTDVRASVSHFQWSQVAERYYQIYTKLLNES